MSLSYFSGGAQTGPPWFSCLGLVYFMCKDISMMNTRETLQALMNWVEDVHPDNINNKNLEQLYFLYEQNGELSAGQQEALDNIIRESGVVSLESYLN